MSTRIEDRDTFMRNVRLSATWSVLFAFVINPVLATSYLFYAIHHQTDDGFLSRELQLKLPMFYMIFSSSILPIAVRRREELRLEQLGYEQRESTTGKIDLVLNVALCVGFLVWMQHEDFEGYSDWQLRTCIVASVFAFWMGVTLAIMGPIWWYTKRVRF
jgi:hypothetical protein